MRKNLTVGIYGLLLLISVIVSNMAFAITAPVPVVQQLPIEIIPGDVVSPASHMAAKEILIKNKSDKIIAITKFTVTGNNPTYVKYCAYGSSSCIYPSTCYNSKKLAPNGSCSIYLEAQKANSIVANNSKVTVTFYYLEGMGKYKVTKTLNVGYENALYVGGRFAQAGSTTTLANNVAKWNGSNWAALASGVDGAVQAMAMYRDDLYVGGFFTNGISLWNGTAWKLLSNGVNGGVRALAVNGNDLFVGGMFNSITLDGHSLLQTNNIVRWDSSSWKSLVNGTNFNNGQVHALATIGTNLYVGGFFTTASGVTVHNIARWDGTNWNSLGNGTDADVDALTVMGKDLYAGGKFATVDGVAAQGLAKWSTTSNSWTSVPGLRGAEVMSLAASGNKLFVGGYLTVLGWTRNECIGVWDSKAQIWNHLGNDVSNMVETITVNGNNLYVGGAFDSVDETIPAMKIALWNISSSSWSPLGGGILGNMVYATLVAPSLTITQ